jgi:hypothetical protein
VTNGVRVGNAQVLVRRVDAWVTGEVVSSANGFVCVRWGSQGRWSYRPSRIKALPWTTGTPPHHVPLLLLYFILSISF